LAGAYAIRAVDYLGRFIQLRNHHLSDRLCTPVASVWGTSIRNILSRLCGVQSDSHTRTRRFHLAFVRNPFTRIGWSSY